MTMKFQIDALEELAALDAQLRDLTERFSKEQKTLSDKKATAKSLEDRLSRGKQSLEEMEKARGDLVGELRQMREFRSSCSREKLARCRTERVKPMRRSAKSRSCASSTAIAEIELEKLDGLIQTGRGEFESVTEQHGAVSGELGSSENDSINRIATSEDELVRMQADREVIVQKVKPDLYRRYEQIRKRKGTALAWTRDGTCSACNIRLQPMLFQKLMRADEFGQCPSCNRILYFRPAVQAKADNQSGV